MPILIYALIYLFIKICVYLSMYVLYSEIEVILTTSSSSIVENQQSLCLTTCGEKGFLFFKHPAFTHVPSVVTASKAIARTGCLEIQFGICVDKFMVLFRWRNLWVSAVLWAFIPHGNIIELNFWESEICQPTKVYPVTFSEESLEGKMSKVSPWRATKQKSERTGHFF